MNDRNERWCLRCKTWQPDALFTRLGKTSEQLSVRCDPCRTQHALTVLLTASPDDPKAQTYRSRQELRKQLDAEDARLLEMLGPPYVGTKNPLRKTDK